ncbi:type IV toxin-antitoxin system AbiEi family antitoxin [Kutzneria sp. NPDC051319]|uniref:type IV toxin-antitoxin system AbiEi family antitoxin domain-containing protein n=1 Tax=Kutzneria sp. NPDC051319 TaxID=3155047 RepID=UPI003421E645
MAGRAAGVPAALARRPNRVFRPQDVADVYAHPRAELARLSGTGVIRRLATGYYAMTPLDRLGDAWRPELEAAALGVAIADYGPDVVALIGASAARHHGALPRAVAVATVAVPKQRPVMVMENGAISFAKRDVTRLDVERVQTELVSGWVTTVEQTLLDIAAPPGRFDLHLGDRAEVMAALGRRADLALVAELAAQQHRPAALRRIRASLDVNSA